MSKKKKIILYIFLAIIVILIGKLVYFQIFKLCGNCGKPPIEKPITSSDKLNDPNLLYASRTSFGLCANKEKESGGCYTEYYLYTDGKLEKITGFVNVDGKKTETPNIQFVSQTAQDFIKKIFGDSGIMTKDCPPQQIMDASWDYQIQLAGVKKSFNNPPDTCKSIFDRVDKILDSTGHLE